MTPRRRQKTTSRKPRSKPSPTPRRRRLSGLTGQPEGMVPIAKAEGLMVDIGATGLPAESRLRVAEGVASTLAGNWSIRPLGEETPAFLFVRNDTELTVSESWHLARTLRDLRDVADAEPALRVPGLEPTGPEGLELIGEDRLPGVRRAFGGRDKDLSGSESCDWNLVQCQVPDAWRRFHGTRPGEAILIGHPDTGYTRHPEIWSDDPQSNRILARQGYDFEGGDPEPEDSRDGANPGHGTSTASVIMSADERPANGVFVVGVAPYASIVPIRVSTSVVHFSYTHLIQALYFAADHGCHVVSMSLGGPLPSRALQQALRYAVARGLILVAAAGNVWPFVIYPGRYDETVCVAASNCERRIWRKSATGPEVDLTAPGESIWNAYLEGEAYAVRRGSGTSFATAMTAGAAALWLSYHGQGELVRRFGRENIASLFKESLLTRGVVEVPGWEKDRVGAGLLNVLDLLEGPLPATARAGAMRTLRPSGPSAPMSPLDELERFLPVADRSKTREGLLRLFDADERELPRILDRFGDELAFHLALNQEVRRSVVSAAGSSGGRRGLQATTRKSLRESARFPREASVDLLRAWT